MHHSLQEFKRKTSKPVVACILGIGCSGAYYLACGCDGIMAQPSSVTGSIIAKSAVTAKAFEVHPPHFRYQPKINVRLTIQAAN